MLLILLIVAPVTAWSGVTADSVTTGIGIVDAFHVEAQAGLKGLPMSVDASNIIKASDGRRGESVKELQSLQWSVAPGRKRYRRVYLIVEPYMEALIASLKSKGAGLNLDEKARLEEVVARLAVIKAAKLKLLEESLKSEVPDIKRETPVPATDQPRGERPPEGGATIWDR